MPSDILADDALVAIALEDAYYLGVLSSQLHITWALVRLNHERAAEEAAGHIRYLHPSYQAPGRTAGPQQQLDIDLPTTATRTSASVADTVKPDWPKELAQQMQAVRDTVQQAGVPLSTKQVAAFFQKTRPEKVQPLLDTLAALALLRQTPEGTYAL